MGEHPRNGSHARVREQVCEPREEVSELSMSPSSDRVTSAAFHRKCGPERRARQSLLSPHTGSGRIQPEPGGPCFREGWGQLERAGWSGALTAKLGGAGSVSTVVGRSSTGQEGTGWQIAGIRGKRGHWPCGFPSVLPAWTPERSKASGL